MCFHTSTQLYYRNRDSKNEIARMILATSQIISIFNSELDFFIIRILFKSEPAQTFMSEVYLSSPIKALSLHLCTTVNRISITHEDFPFIFSFYRFPFYRFPFYRGEGNFNMYYQLAEFTELDTRHCITLAKQNSICLDFCGLLKNIVTPIFKRTVQHITALRLTRRPEQTTKYCQRNFIL